MTGSLRVYSAVGQPRLYERARELVAEYVAATALEMETDPEEFLPFIEGYADFPGVFAADLLGDFLFAETEGGLAGCVGIKRLSPQTCEMKTLWTREGFRGGGVGRALVAGSLEVAKNLGYQQMMLDVLPSRIGAIRLYESFGFEPAPLAHDYHFEMKGFGLSLE